jgi:hypothetical protein
VILLWLLMVACGSRTPDVVCVSADQVVSSQNGQELSCADIESVSLAVSLVAGRPLSERGRARLPQQIRARFVDDPSAARVWLTEVGEVSARMWGGQGAVGAEKRGREAWRSWREPGPLSVEDPWIGNIVREALSVWTTAEAEQLVLTEMDIEGWIYYASLCREVQGGRPLRLSVSDRVTLYRMVQDAFVGADREGKLAMLSVGPFWRNIRARWKAASYEEQQRWIQVAPLPPPMEATSLGYAGAVLEGDLERHASTLHDTLGPFTMRGAP